jgi:glycosyltransferase involved in cell wall biosynthesis
VFTDLPTPPSAFPPVWGQSLADRIGQLFSKERRVAWIYRSPDTSSFRYRVANMVAALNSLEHGETSGSWFSDSELDGLHHLVEHLDAVVVARYPYGAALSRFLARAEQAGVPLIFDVDDLVFDPAMVPLVMEAIGEDVERFERWQTWYAQTGQLHATAQRCQAALTTTEPLRERLEPHFPRGGVEVVPNFLERRQDAYSRELLDAKQSGARSGSVTIGYFSGSATHAHDFAVAAPALGRLLRGDPDVRLRVVGSIDVVGDLAELAERIEVVPFMDFLSLQRCIAEVEVNIAPLQHHAFAVCKSELKYFEAAVVGTWTVASATPAFAAAIDDGRTGRVVRPHEWDDALTEAVALARDPAEYGRRSAQAADEAYRRYGWNVLGQRLQDALAGCGQRAAVG